MKRKLTAILCCVFLGIFAVSAAAAVTVTVGQGAEPVELDPQNITDNPSEELCFQIYEGLVGFDVKDGRLEIAPRLADKWEVSEDGKAWTFSLKKGVQFHSGAAFNAEAVKKNFDRLLSGKYKRSSLFSPFLSEVKVVDEFTVQFILSMSFGPFLHTMCHTAGVIIDPARIDANADIKNNPSGTGPFAFKSWQKGDRITLVAFDKYREGRPKIDTAVFMTIPDDNARTMMLETGEIDIAERISSFEVERLRENKDIDLTIQPGMRVMYFAMNALDPILKEVKVRQAINYAVDRDAICKNILKGFARPIDSPMAFAVNGYAPVKGYEYKPEKAKSLLEEAGWKDSDGDKVLEKDGKKLELRLWSPNGRYPMDLKTAEAVQAYLKAVGIDAKLSTMDWAAYLAATSRKPEENQSQIFLMGWSPSTGDSDWVLRPLFHTNQWVPGGGNRSFYSNPEVDKYVDFGMTENDPAKRKEAYRKAQELIVEDAGWLTMFVLDNVNGRRKNVKGLVESPLELIFLKGVTKE